MEDYQEIYSFMKGKKSMALQEADSHLERLKKADRRDETTHHGILSRYSRYHGQKLQHASQDIALCITLMHEIEEEMASKLGADQSNRNEVAPDKTESETIPVAPHAAPFESKE